MPIPESASIADPICKELRVVLEQIDETDLAAPFRRKRNTTNDQEILDEFIDCEPIRNEYFKTYQSSAVPLPNNAFTRIETSQLSENNQMNDDLLETIDQKIEINILKKVEEIETIDLTDCSDEKPKKSPKRTKAIAPENKNRKKRCIKCPSYKIVCDTNLAVDAFRFGDIDGVEHYFLTHFHADHYIGLKKSFSKNLYLSEITGRLVSSFIKVDEKYMHFLKIHVPIIVDDVEVTALDANQ